MTNNVPVQQRDVHKALLILLRLGCPVNLDTRRKEKREYFIVKKNQFIPQTFT